MQDAGARKTAPEYNPKYVEILKQYNKLNEELKKFDDLKPAKGSDTYTAMTELGHADAPPTHVFFVGDHDRPLEEVQPGFPAAIANGEQPVIVPTATSSGRRTALANWIASPANPLTARVFVNRVWGQYFSRGIVETVSDFGKAGHEAHESRVARLPGRRIRQTGLGHQETASRNSAVERLPGVIGLS